MSLKSLKLECQCGEAAIITAYDLEPFLESDLSIQTAMSLAERFRCNKCGQRGDLMIHDDQERLLFDPERIRRCTGCEELIPYARLQLEPNTQLCTSCSQRGAGPKVAPPHPQPPTDQKTCPKCSAATAMYQNSRYKNWFVGCSTFPTCRWSRWR